MQLVGFVAVTSEHRQVAGHNVRVCFCAHTSMNGVCVIMCVFKFKGVGSLSRASMVLNFFLFILTGCREFQSKACHPQTDLLEGPGLSESVLVYAGIRLAKAIFSILRASARFIASIALHKGGG